jgi:hypothetical protein
MAVEVRAHALGFWDNTRRRPGDVFTVPDDFADKSKWWHRADGQPPAEVLEDRGPNAPGNANAFHVPGSAADVRSRRPASSAKRGKGEDDETDPQPSTAVTGSAALEKPGKGNKPSGDKKVI